MSKKKNKKKKTTTPSVSSTSEMLERLSQDRDGGFSKKIRRHNTRIMAEFLLSLDKTTHEIVKRVSDGALVCCVCGRLRGNHGLIRYRRVYVDSKSYGTDVHDMCEKCYQRVVHEMDTIALEKATMSSTEDFEDSLKQFKSRIAHVVGERKEEED